MNTGEAKLYLEKCKTSCGGIIVKMKYCLLPTDTIVQEFTQGKFNSNSDLMRKKLKIIE